MKKLFTKSLMAVGVAGLFGLTSVAVAAEFDWSGTIRAGYTSTNKGGETDKTVKTIGVNKSSRINLNASTDLGNGQSAGTEVSLSITGSGEEVTTRRNNVWLDGGWGKFTIGTQGNIYRGAANWDQSSYLGGNVRFDGGGGAITGITYKSNSAGPFSFELGFSGVDAQEAQAASAEIAAVGATTASVSAIDSGGAVATVTVDVAAIEAVWATDDVAAIDAAVVGRWAVAAHYKFSDAATVNLGYMRNSVAADGLAEDGAAMYQAASGNAATNIDEEGYGFKPGSYNNLVASVNGSVSGFDYYVAYEYNKANPRGAVQLAQPYDAKTIGVFLGFNVTENDYMYLEYENAKIENLDDPRRTATLVGFRHDLGDGVDVTAEYVSINKAALVANDRPKSLNLVLRYSF